MLVCGFLGIFYLVVAVAVMFGPWLVKSWQSPKKESTTIFFIVIYYVGAIAIGRFVFKILDSASGCYSLGL